MKEKKGTLSAFPAYCTLPVLKCFSREMMDEAVSLLALVHSVPLPPRTNNFVKREGIKESPILAWHVSGPRVLCRPKAQAKRKWHMGVKRGKLDIRIEEALTLTAMAQFTRVKRNSEVVILGQVKSAIHLTNNEGGN